MQELWILAVTRPWHYWLAVALVAGAAMVLLAIAAGYYRKVLVPTYQRRNYELGLWAPRQALPAGQHHDRGRVDRALRAA
jgi:hypothetical protein